MRGPRVGAGFVIRGSNFRIMEVDEFHLLDSIISTANYELSGPVYPLRGCSCGDEAGCGGGFNHDHQLLTEAAEGWSCSPSS